MDRRNSWQLNEIFDFKFYHFKQCGCDILERYCSEQPYGGQGMWTTDLVSDKLQEPLGLLYGLEHHVAVGVRQGIQGQHELLSGCQTAVLHFLQQCIGRYCHIQGTELVLNSVLRNERTAPRKKGMGCCCLFVVICCFEKFFISMVWRWTKPFWLDKQGT